MNFLRKINYFFVLALLMGGVAVNAAHNGRPERLGGMQGFDGGLGGGLGFGGGMFPYQFQNENNAPEIRVIVDELRQIGALEVAEGVVNVDRQAIIDTLKKRLTALTQGAGNELFIRAFANAFLGPQFRVQAGTDYKDIIKLGLLSAVIQPAQKNMTIMADGLWAELRGWITKGFNAGLRLTPWGNSFTTKDLDRWGQQVSGLVLSLEVASKSVSAALGGHKAMGLQAVRKGPQLDDEDDLLGEQVFYLRDNVVILLDNIIREMAHKKAYYLKLHPLPQEEQRKEFSEEELVRRPDLVANIKKEQAERAALIERIKKFNKNRYDRLSEDRRTLINYVEQAEFSLKSLHALIKQSGSVEEMADPNRFSQIKGISDLFVRGLQSIKFSIDPAAEVTPEKPAFGGGFGANYGANF